MFQPPPAVFVPARPALLLALTIIFTSAASSPQQKSHVIRVARWTEGAQGSTFSRTADGKCVYDLKDGDVEISILIDAQELEKVHHRPLPVFAVRLEMHYAGQPSFDLSTAHITLEFVDHYQAVNNALDPDSLAARIQNDIDSLSDETAREVRKHPEAKQKQESLLQAHLKDMTDMVGFISLYSLHGTTLDPGNPSTGGWLFFSTKSKWIGKWKSQEDFVLQVALEDRIFEFPFALPPRKGDLVLRRRED